MADPGSIIAQPGIVYPFGPIPLFPTGTTPKADPKKEYIAGGRRLPFSPGGGFTTLAAHADEAGTNFGPDLWDVMDTEPTVSATLSTLAAAVTAEGVQFYPAISDDPDTASDSADLELADEITAFCERCASDPKLRFGHTLYRWVRASLKLGCKLIEQTFGSAPDGPDKGRLVPVSLKVKPNWAWSFVIDPWGNLVGIVGAVPRPEESSLGMPQLLPEEKFAILSFGQEDDDPRGRSCLRSAYTPWNDLVKLPKERWKFLSRFGTPTWVGLTAPDALDVEILDSSGNPTGAYISAQKALYNGLMALENATAIVAPAGSEITCVEPRSNGEAFGIAKDDCRRDIVFAILCQVRATLESRYGSKADSESGQDILDTVTLGLKQWVSDEVRLMVARWVELNWGEAVARRLTPHVTLGRQSHQDYSRDIRADSEAWGKGMFFESMRRQVLARRGWRVPRNPGPPSGPVLPAGSGLGDPSSEPKPAAKAAGATP